MKPSTTSKLVSKDLASSTSNVKDAVDLTEQYKDSLKNATASLGAIVSASGAITETASSMSGSPEDAAKLQRELKDLTDNLSKLNKIYGGMYHAMHD